MGMILDLYREVAASDPDGVEQESFGKEDAPYTAILTFEQGDYTYLFDFHGETAAQTLADAAHYLGNRFDYFSVSFLGELFLSQYTVRIETPNYTVTTILLKDELPISKERDLQSA